MPTGRIPAHIAFIMDGNGRWADRAGLPRNAGHRKGVEVMNRIVEACKKKGVGVVSVFAFSTENWSRPKDEIDGLFDLVRKYLERGVLDKVGKDGRLNVMGDISAFPGDIQELLGDAVQKTAKNGGFVFNLGINYGGKQEILRAVNNIANSGLKKIDEGIFDSFLYTAKLPPPDMMIRTSGEVRLSNFMLYQLAYAELFFTDTLWPDFSVKELNQLISEYQKRNRRFGAR